MTAAFIEKMIGEVTRGKKIAALGWFFTLLTFAAVAQPLPAGSAAGAEMPVAPPPAVPQQSEPVAPPAPPVEAARPTPEIATPAPIPSNGSAIRARFGVPDFVRREMDNELWRYDAKNCSVFLFLQHRGATLELRYTETLPKGVDMAADPVCLTSLEQRMAKMPNDVTGSAAVQP